MSIKKSNYKKESTAIEILQARMENLLEDKYLDGLPIVIRKKVEEFIVEVGQYEFTNEDIIKSLSGETAKKEEILDIIVKATGYTKWSLEEKTKLTKEDIKNIQKKYAVSFSDTEIYEYRFFRKTNSRNDVNMITVTAIPGYFQISVDTDRADFVFPDLLTSEEAIKELEREC